MFILYNLAQYIDTDYCLVVQDDGWVLNGNNWLDEFWDYDYIGAPVLFDIKANKNNCGQPYLYHNSEIRLFEPEEVIVQNGGFSLRSKRLLELPRKLGLSLPIQPTALADPDELYQIHWDCLHSHNEDLFLTVLMRDTLQQAGIRFAPFSVASYFSFYALDLQKYRPHIPMVDCLGHHFFEKIVIKGFNQLVATFPKSWLEKKEKTKLEECLHPFLKQGYNIIVESK